MISIIAAVADNGIIGGGGTMPWHLGEDLRRFKALTLGHPVVMGRKTFQSLGRPLPGRTNVVITRDNSFRPEGCLTAASIDEAIAMLPRDEEIFIIGGGEIYRQTMPLADRMYLTLIHTTFEGDTHFPDIDYAAWRETSFEHHDRGTEFPFPFDFVNYERRPE